MAKASPDFGPCRVREIAPAKPWLEPALVLENAYLSARIVPGKGGDLTDLVYLPRQMNVLWKSPWSQPDDFSRQPASDGSQTAWLESYEGGWQEIFPNGGDACHYHGVELGFHGEASLARWNYEITEPGGQAAEIRLEVRLKRSPFRLERRLRVEQDRPVLMLRERITNEGGEDLEYMWGHHPAYGAPFLSGACRLDLGSSSFQTDDRSGGPADPLPSGQRYDWPLSEKSGLDLSQIPPSDPATPRHLLAYFDNFEAGWYGLTNLELGFGVGLVWPREVFPYAWCWQEMYASGGFPWYKAAYVMAVEPFSSFPSQGLLNVRNKTGTQRVLRAGQMVEAELAAVFYESKTGITGIEPDGRVVVREK
jgi:hypothetical protein